MVVIKLSKFWMLLIDFLRSPLPSYQGDCAIYEVMLQKFLGLAILPVLLWCCHCRSGQSKNEDDGCIACEFENKGFHVFMLHMQAHMTCLNSN